MLFPPHVVLSYIIGPVVIIFCHLASLLIIPYHISASAFAWACGLYLLRMLAITSVYHRLLTHKSYQAPNWFLWTGCFIGASAGQMGPSWWKAHHLAHHVHSDQNQDPHSPHRSRNRIQGFLFSQVGWLFSNHFFPSQLPSDIEEDDVLRIIDRLHFIPPVLLGILSYAIGGLDFLLGFFLSTVVLFHGVASVNSVSHLWGSQPFQTSDSSRNNAFVALLTLGEGWHNLHHACPHSSRQGFCLLDDKVILLPDPTFRFIQLLQSLGITSHMKIPSSRELARKSKRLAYTAFPEYIDIRSSETTEITP